MRTRFIKSAAARGGFPPPTHFEVAFLGRSNVGKSTLLNALVGARIARTSRTPGRTQLINFFDVHAAEGDMVVADLPGYGFARAPTGVVEAWRGLCEDYLEHREALGIALLLVDLRRGVEPDDELLHAWLSERGVPVWLVCTKSDKLPKAKQKPAAAAAGRQLGLAPDAVFTTAASTGLGIRPLYEALWAASEVGRSAGSGSNVLTGRTGPE